MALRVENMLVLDTNILIDIEKNNLAIKDQLKKYILLGAPAITALTYAEFLYGYLSKQKDAVEQALKTLDLYRTLHTTKKSCRLIAELQYELEKKGTPLPLADIVTAAIVLENNATLITRDRDFKRIERLNAVYLE
ncbi:type II toxin-antitoxin system VapC family toxin [Candidatus Woesearchaeota archaeon]|nr:type II toxin-antitoxin system VapC family toxin [Candidatus Woesearchaeota archaeon]